MASHPFFVKYNMNLGNMSRYAEALLAELWMILRELSNRF
jgi:hypothetical protein